jgi:hypothetical protein
MYRVKLYTGTKDWFLPTRFRSQERAEAAAKKALTSDPTILAARLFTDRSMTICLGYWSIEESQLQVAREAT